VELSSASMAETHSVDEHVAALDLALSELQQALATGEASTTFQRLGSALHWMYAASEQIRDHANVGALGGLRWARGKVTHVGAAVREQRLEKAYTYVRQDGELLPATPRLRRGGEWLPVTVRVTQAFWTDLAHLDRRTEWRS
jgi:hypothetical protein